MPKTRKRLRDNGQGTIYYVGTGKRKRRWRAELPSTYEPVLDENGEQVYKKEGIPAVKRVSSTLGYYATKQEAIDALNEYLKNPQYYTNLTVANLWKEYFENTDIGQSNSSKVRYDRVYKNIAGLYDTKIKDLSKIALRDFIKGVLQDYIADDIKSVLTAVFEYAVKMDYLPTNVADFPYKKRVLPKEVQAKEDAKLLSTEDIRFLWEHRDDKFVKFLLILLYSGMRRAELYSVEEYNFSEGYVVIGENAKNAYSRNRVVPIHPKVEYLFKEWAKKPFFARSSLINGNAPSASYEKLDYYIKTHSCRHTFISRLQATEGVKEIVIQKIVGHAPENIMQSTYTHITKETMIDTVRKLDYGVD